MLGDHLSYSEQYSITVDYVDGKDLGNLGHLIYSIDDTNIFLVQDTIILDPSRPVKCKILDNEITVTWASGVGWLMWLYSTTKTVYYYLTYSKTLVTSHDSSSSSVTEETTEPGNSYNLIIVQGPLYEAAYVAHWRLHVKLYVAYLAQQ